MRELTLRNLVYSRFDIICYLEIYDYLDWSTKPCRWRGYGNTVNTIPDDMLDCAIGYVMINNDGSGIVVEIKEKSCLW